MRCSDLSIREMMIAPARVVGKGPAFFALATLGIISFQTIRATTGMRRASPATR